MKNAIFLIIILIILFKVLANGTGFFGISIWFALIYIGMYASLLYILKEKHNIGKLGNYGKYITYCFLLLFIIVFVNIANNLFVSNIKTILQFVSMIGLSIMTYIVINNYKQLYIVNNIIIISIILSAIIGIGQFLNIEFAFELQNILKSQKTIFVLGQRVSGLSSTVITLSYELIIGITLLFSKLLFYNNKLTKKILMIVCLLILIITLVINQTRSAIVITAINIVMISALHIKKSNINFNKVLLLLVTVIVIITSSIILISEFNVYTRFQSDKSSSVRVPMLIIGMKYALKNPLGTGVYNLVDHPVEMNYSSDISNSILNHDTHNHLVNILVCYGFVGFFIALKIYQILFNSFIEFRSSEKANKYIDYYIYFICIISYALNGMTHNIGIFSSDPLIWLIISMFFTSNNHIDTTDRSEFYKEVTSTNSFSS